MIVHTERLLLRPITPDDLSTAFAYAGDPETCRLMMFLPYADLNETAQALQDAADEWGKTNPERLEFAILREGRHIGSITLYFQGPPDEMELGWILHRDHWRQGYVTEAALALMNLARQRGIRRVFACCDSENAASLRVMEKLGMHQITCNPGRRNRGMDEDRNEIVCEIWLDGSADRIPE